MKSPSVTFGLPVYNGELYLRACLESLLAQTFTDFEIIISDNCSTDQTESISHEYAQKDPRIKYFRQSTNLGAAGNFQKVFALGQGYYFKWVAYDDLHSPVFLERCITVLEAQKDVVLCFGGTVIIDAQGEKVADYHDLLKIDSPYPSIRFQHFLRELGLCNSMFGLFRREQLGCTPLIAKFVASDVTMLAELALMGKYYFVPETLFYRRVHAQASASANPNLSGLSSWYDPKNEGRLVLPTWTHFRKYFGAILRVPMSISEKIKCFKALISWAYFEVQDLKQESKVAVFWFWNKKIVRH